MFSRRKDEMLVRLQGESDRQMAVIGVLEDQIEKLFDVLASSQDEKESLLEAHTKLVDAHRELQAQYEAARRIQPVVPMGANMPMFVPEYEEELEWARDNGLIDENQLKEMLESAGFENNEVHFDN